MAFIFPEFNVAMFPIVAVKVFMIPVTKAKIPPEIFVTVVEPSVELPVEKIFPKDPIPVTVVDPEFNEATFPACAIKFAKVEEPRVVEPDVKFVTYFPYLEIFVLNIFFEYITSVSHIVSSLDNTYSLYSKFV